MNCFDYTRQQLSALCLSKYERRAYPLSQTRTGIILRNNAFEYQDNGEKNKKWEELLQYRAVI